MASPQTIENQGVVLSTPRVRWSLVHQDGGGYRLQNEGDLTAEDVEISSDPSLPLRLINTPNGRPCIQPGEAITFAASMRLGTRDRTITVTWTDHGDRKRHTWRYPLPARPPRR